MTNKPFINEKFLIGVMQISRFTGDRRRLFASTRNVAVWRNAAGHWCGPRRKTEQKQLW